MDCSQKIRTEQHLLHDLILSQASCLGLHRITAARSLILDEGQAKRTTPVLVSRELLNGSIGVLGSIESNNTSSAGSAIWLVLDLGLLDLANGGEELNEIFVAGRPRKLLRL